MLRKVLGTVFGSMVGLAAILWCLAGAGIYGSPLQALTDSRELRFVELVLVFGPLAAALAGGLVWFSTRWAARVLAVGGAATAALLGRYLDLVWYLLALPLCMLLMARLLDPQAWKGSQPLAVPSVPSRLTLRGALMATVLVVLVWAHWSASRVQPFAPSGLLQELSDARLPAGRLDRGEVVLQPTGMKERVGIAEQAGESSGAWDRSSAQVSVQRAGPDTEPKTSIRTQAQQLVRDLAAQHGIRLDETSASATIRQVEENLGWDAVEAWTYRGQGNEGVIVFGYPPSSTPSEREHQVWVAAQEQGEDSWLKRKW